MHKLDICIRETTPVKSQQSFACRLNPENSASDIDRYAQVLVLLHEAHGHAVCLTVARACSVPKTRAAHRANSYFMELYWKIRSSLYLHLLGYNLILTHIRSEWE